MLFMKKRTLSRSLDYFPSPNCLRHAPPSDGFAGLWATSPVMRHHAIFLEKPLDLRVQDTINSTFRKASRDQPEYISVRPCSCQGPCSPSPPSWTLWRRSLESKREVKELQSRSYDLRIYFTYDGSMDSNGTMFLRVVQLGHHPHDESDPLRSTAEWFFVPLEGLLDVLVTLEMVRDLKPFLANLDEDRIFIGYEQECFFDLPVSWTAASSFPTK